ncbi:class I SAM-dependent DNA methyltransferase [Larkinella sp. C7]|uniref:type I restriction-modification system subunit M n=1 Tax=Larkinella sp. C7 TaxID=2576607 RepID=UPI0011110225|nr:class I SAM-dependent DNA methyltransferase [Larkinella sp. C7]
MLTGELRTNIDRVWNAFWTGGLSNPLTVIEQITYLLFLRRLDELQTAKESLANATQAPIDNPIYTPEQYDLRWSHFNGKDPETLYRLFTQPNGVFEFIRSMGKESAFGRYMKGATFMIPTPRLLAQVVDLLNLVPMRDRDTKGDVYEYLLAKIATAGQNGQFRTPRHIIKMMVAILAPQPDDIICDPSAGSAGFLVAAGEYVAETHKQSLLKTATQDHYRHRMLMGMEFDPTMIRIGAMNLLLHGIEPEQLADVDALSKSNASFADSATMVLANPPFKGSLDADHVMPDLIRMVETKKTELLFLALILRGLRPGGRAAVIVPDGVLFGNSKGHRQIRRELVEHHHLQAVISMPSGVFKPYAGVSTAVLIFTRTNTGGTNQVWFYDMRADGYSLDDKRAATGPDFEKFADLERLITQNEETPITTTDIPDIISRWRNRAAESSRARTDQSFMVPVDEIRENAYDLSINRYKEVVYAQKSYDTPETIIAQINALDAERQDDLKALAELLAEPVAV